MTAIIGHDFNFIIIHPVIIKYLFACFSKNSVAGKYIIYLMDASDIDGVSTALFVTRYFPLFFCEKSKISDYGRYIFYFIDRIFFYLIGFI